MICCDLDSFVCVFQELVPQPRILNHFGHALSHLNGVFDENSYVELTCQVAISKQTIVIAAISNQLSI